MMHACMGCMCGSPACTDDMHACTSCGTVYSCHADSSQISVKVYKSIINIVFGYNVHTIINGVYTKCMVISKVILFTEDERT